MTEIKNRSEIVFLYDIKDANPNGDPLDENKPRIDEETGINIVTDVRLKRTIRDYLHDFKGYNGENEKDILIREIRDKNDIVKDMKTRARDFGKNKKEIEDNLLKNCIDVRLFGGTVALPKDSVTFTGPVQFKIGRSLNKVELKEVGHSFTMAGKGKNEEGEGPKAGSLASEYVVNYSLICFYGIINENAAKHTQLTKSDVGLLLEGMWNGTKNLISRSKAGQMPRLLLKVNYKEKDYHIGDLDGDEMIKLVSEKNEEQIRDISEITLDASKLVEKLNKNKDKIESINLKVDDRVNIDLDGLDKEIPINEIQIK
ncbi:type I-B CRISPR-associated protein Cas7/Csh2 [Candidatus Altiarchaeales archaeon WOR_SM1_SCG]|nr:type I-B CRISPR-associated protein Cas7/Csh2 [Candidatus Altiarchaeales archaeon WOR_SM1_SCG]